MMKAICIMSTFAGLTLSPVAAQPGYVDLFTDTLYTNCEFYDVGGTLVTIYVRHQTDVGARGCLFRLVQSSYFSGVYLSERTYHNATGNTQSGVSFDYGMCLTSQILLASVRYALNGQSPDCSYLQVVGAPGASSGGIEITNCVGSTLQGSTHLMFVDPNPSCPAWCSVLPVKPSTWGRIKALYE